MEDTMDVIPYRRFCNGKKTGQGGCASSHEPLLCIENHGYGDEPSILPALGSAATLFSLQSCRPDWPRVDSRCRLPRALPTLQISLGKEVVCIQLLRIRVGKSHGRLQGVHICSLLAQDFRAVTRKLDGQGPWCGSPKPMLAAISASPTYPEITVRLIASTNTYLTSLIRRPSRASRLCSSINIGDFRSA